PRWTPAGPRRKGGCRSSSDPHDGVPLPLHGNGVRTFTARERFFAGPVETSTNLPWAHFVRFNSTGWPFSNSSTNSFSEIFLIGLSVGPASPLGPRLTMYRILSPLTL